MKYFDLHCDTLCRCLDENQPLESNDFDVDLMRLSKFESAIQVFAAFIDDDFKGNAATERFLQLYKIFSNASFSEFSNIKPILSIENLNCLNDDIDNIHRFKQCGVKIASLVWNGENSIAGGVKSEKTLTDFGISVIKELEAADIIIDVSHLNEKSFYEVIKHITKPIIASHSNSKAICPHNRNLTNEQFKIIRDTGGVVGINIYPLFIGKRAPGYLDIIKHIEHFLTMDGENVVALGTDFDGAQMDNRFKSVADMDKFYKKLSKYFSKDVADKIYYKNAANLLTNTAL